MNIRDLKYLVALAEHGHFGKAAESCFISQPALSMQIKKLEEFLGVKLLERTNKTVLLTDCGMKIVERAQQILNQVEEVCEIAKQSKDPFSGELRVGVFPTLGPYLLPHIIPALSKAYPNLSLLLIEQKTADLVENLKQGKIDTAILSVPITEKSFEHALLFNEEFVLAVPANHELSQLKMIKQKNLSNKNLLLLEEGHCLRDQALTVCYDMQADETQNFRATSLETLRQMVVAGVGMTLIPKLACDTNKLIAYIPFAETKPIRQIAMFWRKNSARRELLDDLVNRMKGKLAKIGRVEVVA